MLQIGSTNCPNESIELFNNIVMTCELIGIENIPNHIQQKVPNFQFMKIIIIYLIERSLFSIDLRIL